MQFKIQEIQICGQSGYCFTDDPSPQFAVYTEGGSADRIEIRVSHSGHDGADSEDWAAGFEHQSFIRYSGIALSPKTNYLVEVLAEKDGNRVSASASFDTGFLGGDWEAKWIEPQQERAVPEPELLFHQTFIPKFWGTLEESKLRPAQVIYKTFQMDSIPEQAVLYASAHGVYQVRINGSLPDERRLAPEISAYQENLYYQRYDLTEFIVRGENTLEFTVADGWWIGRIGLIGSSCQYGDMLGLIAQLEITKDSFTEVIGSDESFLSAESRIRYADLYIGEKWDLTYPQGAEMHNCRETDTSTANLCAQSLAPVRVVETLDGKLFRTPGGDLLVDFGQIIAGVVNLKLNASGKRIITLEHCEVLSHGEFYRNIVGRNKQQLDTLISDSWPCEFEPQFTYHGFRYVRIVGVAEEEIERIQAKVIRSPIRFQGEFRCSDDRLTKLQQNIQWSMRGNFVSIPTDCPQREKMGWSGDILTFAETAMCNADLRGFLENWLANMRLEQKADGEVPNYIPDFPTNDRVQRRASGDNTSAAWGDACIIVPWVIYESTGDIRVLADNLDMMERWLAFIDRAVQVMPKDYDSFDEAKKERYHYLWHSGHHYGDWLIPSFMKEPDGMHRGMIVTAEIVSSAFYAVTLRTYIQVLEALNMSSDVMDGAESKQDGYEKKIRNTCELLDKVKAAVRDEYIAADGSVPGDLQGLYVILLYADIAEGELKSKVVSKLVELIHRDGDQLNTGFVSTPYLLPILSENGYSDLAWKLLIRDQAPSWLYQVKKGATTIWESWEAVTEDDEVTTSSFNHYALGSVGAWMYRYIGGIRHVDFNKEMIVFEPYLDCGLASAAVTVQKPFGKVHCEWKKEGRNIEIRIQSPVKFLLNIADERVESAAGEYVFRFQNPDLSIAG